MCTGDPGSKPGAGYLGSRFYPSGLGKIKSEEHKPAGDRSRRMRVDAHGRHNAVMTLGAWLLHATRGFLACGYSAFTLDTALLSELGTG